MENYRFNPYQNLIDKINPLKRRNGFNKKKKEEEFIKTKKEKGLIIKKESLTLTDNWLNLIVLNTLIYYLKDKSIIVDSSFYNKLNYINGLCYTSTKKGLNNLIKLKIIIKDNNEIRFNKDIYNKLKNSKPMFRIPESILFNKQLNLNEKIILAYVLAYTKKYGNCLSHNKTISKDLNLCISTIDNAFRKFRELELLEVDNKNSKGCILKRIMKTNETNIKEFYNNQIEYLEAHTIENINTIDKIEYIDNTENINTVDNIENINTIENINNTKNIENIDNTEIINTEKIENINKASIILLNDLSNIDLSSCSDTELNKLYFSLKNQMELIKVYKNNKT